MQNQYNSKNMLRSVDKENILPSTPSGQFAGTTKTKGSEKVTLGLTPQKDTSGASELTVQKINFEVFQSEIRRLSEACENQRKETWAATQAKNKLENQVKVLNVQKNNLDVENKRIRTELNDVITKMRDVQNKANQQISEFYILKNQNASLQIEAKQQRENSQKWQKNYTTLQATQATLQAQIVQLKGEVGTWRNQCSLRDNEIQYLRRVLFELETENKRLAETHDKCAEVSDQKLNQICNQVQNWKIAFEKKDQELETKTMVLSEQNNMMKKTIDQLTAQCMTASKTTLMRSCSLPTEVSEKNNDYYVRLFVKENQIDKLNQKIKTLTETVENLTLENALLNKKCTEGTIFSPSGYQRYTEVQNAILKNNDLKKQTRNLQTELETKQKQVQQLQERLQKYAESILLLNMDHAKLQSLVNSQRISFDNKISELTFTKTKLERQTETLKTKLESLQRECQEKDKIIINYVNKQKV